MKTTLLYTVGDAPTRLENDFEGYTELIYCLLTGIELGQCLLSIYNCECPFGLIRELIICK